MWGRGPALYEHNIKKKKKKFCLKASHLLRVLAVQCQRLKMVESQKFNV
jgi:hypothetical protein